MSKKRDNFRKYGKKLRDHKGSGKMEVWSENGAV